MGKLFSAIGSLFSAFGLCLFDTRYRSLAIKPWLIGLAVYFGALTGAYYAHGPLLRWAVADPTGYWSWIIYLLVWVAVTFGLLVSSMIVSVAVIMVFSSLFQTGLVKVTLTDLGVPFPPDPPGVHGTIKEAARTIYVESAKLLWIAPLGLLAFVTGLLPILLPLTVLLISWLLAYQFTDVVLDVLKVPPFRRLRLAMKNPGTMIWFGLGLAALWAIPFLGFLLPPVAAVAAARYLNGAGFLKLADAGVESAIQNIAQSSKNAAEATATEDTPLPK